MDITVHNMYLCPNPKLEGGTISCLVPHLGEAINTTATVISDVLAHTAVLEAQEAQGYGEVSLLTWRERRNIMTRTSHPSLQVHVYM